MAISSDILKTIESAYDAGVFEESFINEVKDATEWAFFIKLLEELGHDVSNKKDLVNNDMINGGTKSWVISLRTQIIEGNVFRVLFDQKETAKALEKKGA